jgi:serine protease Do
MIPVLAALWVSSAVMQDEEPLRVHTRLYEKISPAIVGVRGRGRRGTGIIVNKSGFILTSLTAIGTSGDTVQVYLKGHKKVDGKVLHRERSLEMAVVRIEPKDVPATIVFGDSDAVKIGQVSYVLADSYNSIFTDDQVALTLGHISGRYDVDKNKNRTYYKGPVIETSAKVNPNGDGGALVDAKGNLLGMITMNYHEAKFTGIAIPVNALKDKLREVMAANREPGWIGLKVSGTKSRIKVTKVSRDSPAEKAGIKKGDLIIRIGKIEPDSVSEAKDLIKKCYVGEAIEIEVLRNYKALKFKVVPETGDAY